MLKPLYLDSCISRIPCEITEFESRPPHQVPASGQRSPVPKPGKPVKVIAGRASRVKARLNYRAQHHLALVKPIGMQAEW